MPLIDKLIQEPGSYDCGYFSSTVVAVHSKTGAGITRAEFTRTDVYAKRDKFLTEMGVALPEGKAEKHQALDIEDAPRFLTQLGCTGFKTTWSGSSTPEARRADLRRYCEPVGNGKGIIISMSVIHWIAVLGYYHSREKNGELVRRYLVYNSAKTKENSASCGRPRETSLIEKDNMYGTICYFGG